MVLEGPQVRHDLAGVRAPRQPVDDGHGGMRRKLQQCIMVEDADHDRIDVTRQHARGIGDGLAAAELHFRTRQHDGLAAELTHADVERHPRSGRWPLENHRQCLAFERLVDLMRLLLRLHGDAGRQHVAQFLRRQLADIQEVTKGLAHHPAAFLGLSTDSATQARSRRCTDSSISDSETIKGARKRTTLSPAPTVSNFWSRSAVTRSPEGTTALTPTSKPSPRTSANTPG